MKEKITIHEVKDKPKIVVDKNSPAAYLVAAKFIGTFWTCKRKTMGTKSCYSKRWKDPYI